MAKASTKKRKVIVEAVGEAHITASFNNIIISLTNKKGDVISWSSAGKMGFRGSKKNTPYAAQLAAEDCATAAELKVAISVCQQFRQRWQTSWSVNQVHVFPPNSPQPVC